MIGEEIIGIIGRTGTVFQHRSGPSNDLDWRSSVPAEKLPDSSAFSQPPDVRLIPLTKGKFAIVDAADFGWLSRIKWQAEYVNGFWIAKSTKRQGTKKMKHLRMHRLILGAPAGIQVDHRDGNTLHNWRGNLRLATCQQNLFNRGLNRNNRSGAKGVTWDKVNEKWIAQIGVNRKNIKLGRFTDKSVAIKAYEEAAKKYAGEFARWEPFDRTA